MIDQNVSSEAKFSSRRNKLGGLAAGLVAGLASSMNPTDRMPRGPKINSPGAAAERKHQKVKRVMSKKSRQTNRKK